MSELNSSPKPESAFEVKHEQEEHKGRFYFEKGKLRVAELTYTRAGEQRIIIDHTQVNDDWRGQHLGEKLVDAAVQYARSQQITILPLCPFARTVFKKNHTYHDVLNT